MTRRFSTQWIRRLMQDGRCALHRHDLDGRDHDRHHPGPAHRGRHHETSGTGPYSTASNSRPCNSLPSAGILCDGVQRAPILHHEHGRGHSKRHQGLRREPLASTSTSHSSMRRRWNMKSHRRKRTSSSMTTTTMTMLRIPRARGQLLRRQTRRMLRVSALRVRQAPTEGAPASCR